MTQDSPKSKFSDLLRFTAAELSESVTEKFDHHFGKRPNAIRHCARQTLVLIQVSAARMSTGLKKATAFFVKENG